MASAFISSVHKTAAGTITVPEGCTLIAAIVKGSVTPPQIGGIPMTKVAGVEAQAIIPALSIHQWQLPDAGDHAFTFTGTWAEFVFLSGADTYRPGSVFGYNSGGVWTGTLPTGTADIVIGVLCGSIGPTTLKGDTVALTYLVNAATEKAGYIIPGDSSLSCEAADTGVSAGYWIDGGSQYHPAYIITAGYYTYVQTLIPGYWHDYRNVYVPGYWTEVPYHHFVPGYYVLEGYNWVSTHYEYIQTWIPPVWSDPWTEEFPDTWVPPGTSQISAVYCSISSTPTGGFVPRAVFFN